MCHFLFDGKEILKSNNATFPLGLDHQLSTQALWRKYSTMTAIRALILLLVGTAAVASHVKKPNFILIMTDDQDLLMDSINYQPSVQKHFAKEGTWFKKHFCTVSLCCPSRVSFLTGKAAHNTNVTDVAAPYGMSQSHE
jgi:hypothetical protein